MAEASGSASGVSVFFQEVGRLVDQSERQYGLANRTYTEYVIERLEYVITVCSDLCDHFRGTAGLEEYSRSVEELKILSKLYAENGRNMKEYLMPVQ